ncbi:MAG: hypothetical protein H7A23_08465 [Leptospiraceae bacterium]|nr:hypothetical protein [Leptospiraceae bacterium]MCP5494579.1 hypothetical protein [Leptospiraceae bacterium]
MITKEREQTYYAKNFSIPNKIENKKKTRYLFSIFFVIILSITLYVFLNMETNSDAIQLQNFEARIESGETLKDYEKEAFCELLWKVKKIRLCACKENYNKKLGSITGYVMAPNDLDWRGSNKTFVETLQEAFRLTGVPKEEFVAKKWAKDVNGKSGVVLWEAPGGAKVSIDAPHTTNGPDVFHIGYQGLGRKNRIRGHIFLDCVPYFRESK